MKNKNHKIIDSGEKHIVPALVYAFTIHFCDSSVNRHQNDVLLARHACLRFYGRVQSLQLLSFSESPVFPATVANVFFFLLPKTVSIFLLLLCNAVRKQLWDAIDYRLNLSEIIKNSSRQLNHNKSPHIRHICGHYRWMHSTYLNSLNQ